MPDNGGNGTFGTAEVAAGPADAACTRRPVGPLSAKAAHSADALFFWRPLWPLRRMSMGHSMYDPGQDHRPAWNAGHKLGAKRPLKPKQVWAIRFWLERERRLRDRALFDLAIASKLRGCDLVKIRIGDLVSGGRIRARGMVIQQKTARPVQFELLEPARTAILDWLERRCGGLEDFVFPSRTEPCRHMSTVSMLDWWTSGSAPSAYAARIMAPILFAERRLR